MPGITEQSDLLHRILSGIAFQPVKVSFEVRSQKSYDLTALVHADDMGLLMGRDAQTIKAIQALFRFAARASGLNRIDVRLNAHGVRVNKFHPKKPWAEPDALDLVESICRSLKLEAAHVSLNEKDGCLDLSVLPEPPEALSAPINDILKSYGQSHGKILGLE